MDKKILNVKYAQSCIAGMNAEDLENLTSSLRELISVEFDDKYIVVFTPFDFQEIPDEGLVETIYNVLNTLKDAGKQHVIDDIMKIVNEFVSEENECVPDSNESE